MSKRAERAKAQEVKYKEMPDIVVKVVCTPPFEGQHEDWQRRQSADLGQPYSVAERCVSDANQSHQNIGQDGKENKSVEQDFPKLTSGLCLGDKNVQKQVLLQV